MLGFSRKNHLAPDSATKRLAPPPIDALVPAHLQTATFAVG